MNIRSKTRLDYVVWNRKGEKVIKNLSGKIETVEMDENQNILTELKVREDLKYTLEIYDIEDLETQDEINEGGSSVAELAKNYRHVHVELRTTIGDYNKKYPEYEHIFSKQQKSG